MKQQKTKLAKEIRRIVLGMSDKIDCGEKNFVQ